VQHVVAKLDIDDGLRYIERKLPKGPCVAEKEKILEILQGSKAPQHF